MDSETFKPCAIVPVYNHAYAVQNVIRTILAMNIPVLLVDDGSDDECRSILETAADHDAGVYLLRLPENRGKGAAVKAGLITAAEQGYSHAIQIDADGQHNVGDATAFLDAAKRSSSTLVCGYPNYDMSVPKIRFYARYLTHVWVWINSMSFSIKDTMCGFRVYPVGPTVDLINAVTTGNRMEFDTEIMVHWVWQGGRVINLPTSVSYPTDGVSHLRPWQDNYLISKMHASLFFRMLWRLPALMRRNFSNGEVAKRDV